MNRTWLVLGVALAVSLSLPGCSTGQQLVSIDVTPKAIIFGSACLPGDTNCGGVFLTATGTYTHPPATKNITTQVTWTSAIPEVVTVDSSGMLTAGAVCGVATVTASDSTGTPNGSLITGTATVTVDGPAAPCPTTPI
jgi:hypothetical protein